MGDAPQVRFQKVADAVGHGQGSIIGRSAVGDDDQDTALLAAAQQPAIGPFQRLAIDVLLGQARVRPLVSYPAPIPATAVGGLVDNVQQFVQAPWRRRTTGPDPGLTRAPAAPGAGRKAENFHPHPDPQQHRRENFH